MHRETWAWNRCGAKIATLKGRLGFPDLPYLEFLRLSLSLETGRIYDQIGNTPFSSIEPSAYCILSGYADSHLVPETKRLISFSQLPGGQAYNNAFVRRAIWPIEKVFGPDAGMLLEAAQRFDCERLGAGDYSVKIRALPLVPITIALYEASSEFSASANMLFDSSVNNYLSTEQVAMLGELTAARLKHASDAFSHSIS